MTYDVDDMFHDKNYQNWRKIHANAFGDLFSEAFTDNEAAQYLFTAALIDISKRCFEIALLKLENLSDMCSFMFDEAVVNYFKGLIYEMLQNEEMMTEYYEKLRLSNIDLDFPIAFHPYYRTAKFAQRDAECSKAINYYQKALAFYENATQTSPKSTVVGQILYDIATVYLYMHQYDLAEKTLALSKQYSPADNEQRQYVSAVLKAVQGKHDDCDAIVDALPGYLQSSGRAIVQAIRSKTDLHYGIVPQNRTGHNEFVKWFLQNRPQFDRLISQGNIVDVEINLSDKLTSTFPFMQKNLQCRIEIHSKAVIVKCKTYCVKTLKAEYAALFSLCRQAVKDWRFVAIDEFEK